MKPLLCALLLVAMLFTLCACGKEPAPTTTAAPQPTTTQAPPECVHVYKDADCQTPKACILCGITRGNALGHDYKEGICTRCSQEDPTFVALLDSFWRTDALNESGSQLERISLRFNEDGTAMFAAGIYDRLADIPEDQRDGYVQNEENLYDYSGELYCYAGYGVYDIVTYSVDGNMITCTLGNDEETVATMILERTAGNMLTVTYFEGNFSIYYLQVGDVLMAEN